MSLVVPSPGCGGPGGQRQAPGYRVQSGRCVRGLGVLSAVCGGRGGQRQVTGCWSGRCLRGCCTDISDGHVRLLPMVIRFRHKTRLQNPRSPGDAATAGIIYNIIFKESARLLHINPLKVFA